MKVLVAYSSLSGSTKRLAEGIYFSLPVEDKTIAPIDDSLDPDAYDVVLVGYWADCHAPCKPAEAFLKKIHGKYVGVFGTLAYHPDSQMGWGLVQKGLDILKESNTILGSFVCNGALSPAMLRKFRTPGPDGKSAATAQNEIRWKISACHPTPVDIAMASERFWERLEILQAHLQAGLPFSSIL